MPSSMRLAQEYLDNCFCRKRAIRQPTNGPRPMHSGTQGMSEPCVQREPIERVLNESRRERNRETDCPRRGSETDRMDALSEVVEAGGETDRLDALSEIVKGGEP